MRTSVQNRRIVSTAVLSALLAVGVTATEAPTALAHPATTTAAVSQASSLTVKAGRPGVDPTAVQLRPTAHGYAANARGISPGGSGAVFLKFDKNPNDVTSARLYVMRGNRVVASYRAGSGVNKKVCTTGKGWLPNATYTIGLHSRTYDGQLIKGYAIRLADKRCNNNGTTGRKRTELFIHSEMTRTGGQGVGERRKWTERNPNDFYSNGCIKLRPNDIKSMFRLLDQIGWPQSLKVVN
ncbi:L,D-transpeptidase [Streptomyces sp. NPDC002306]